MEKCINSDSLDLFCDESLSFVQQTTASSIKIACEIERKLFNALGMPTLKCQEEAIKIQMISMIIIVWSHLFINTGLTCSRRQHSFIHLFWYLGSSLIHSCYRYLLIPTVCWILFQWMGREQYTHQQGTQKTFLHSASFAGDLQFFINVYLIYNIMLVASVQYSDPK